MIIDFKEHRITVQDKTIWLTSIQNKLLEVLYNNKNRVVTSEEIVNSMYQTKCDSSLKCLIRRHMTVLRKKIGQYIKIKNVREVGYIIEEEI